MRLVILSLLLVSFSPSFSQDLLNCRVLVSLLSAKEAQHAFLLDLYKDSPIIIVDTKRKFGNCSVPDMYDRKVEIVHDSSCVLEKGISYIIVHDIRRKGKIFQVELQQKATGVYGSAKLKKVGGEIIILKFSIGYT